MLRLKDITKDYIVAGKTQQVLKGLNISFRKNEFVSILGPSGCGKTTTLNIIGGLDKYTSGDLFISGKSTKDFSSRDWDIYRNERIGFIFQTYNLIPHQNILSNVELALAITGLKKEERKKRAKQALDKVGLEGLYHKKPNQLSGGQCQRVAIARALVNEPDILLADEPTGALDSQTSLQIMDLIKEISKDKLVIMVTHNPELAQKYSTRIISLVDGEVKADTNPYSESEEIKEEKSKTEKSSKSKMSWWTAFKLSARNLFSKRARTILTCIAGSIGIIGISVVLALSNGVQSYISHMENDMLSGTPITVSEETLDLDVISNLTFQSKKEILKKQQGQINVDSLMQDIADRFKDKTSIVLKNNITQDYIDYVSAIPKNYAAVNVTYGLDFTNNIYTQYNEDENVSHNYSLSAIKTIYTSILKHTKYKDAAPLIASLDDVFMQSISNEDYISSQYNLLTGKMAREKDEIMLVVDKHSALTDLFLAQIGYIRQDEFINYIYKTTKDEKFDPELDKNRFSYQELLNKTFTWFDNDTIFSNNAANPYSPFTYKHENTDFEGGLELKVVGILEPKENVNYGCLTSGMYYTQALAEYAIEQNKDSEVVNALGEQECYSNTSFNPQYGAITYNYSYNFEGENVSEVGIVGRANQMLGFLSSFMPGAQGGDVYQLSKRELGGYDIANNILIYPINSEDKIHVIEYLDAWNGMGDIVVGGKTIKADEREKITYTDTLSLIISMINSMVKIVTIALVGFTSLSLFVSCVMIAIMTYVSVMERVKEIGVIRSLGGRKIDVANLFNAENLMIGFSSGFIGVLITYLLVLIINIIVKHMVGFAIAIFPIYYALIMIALSVALTMLAGIIPAFKASKQDPVVALRTE